MVRAKMFMYSHYFHGKNKGGGGLPPAAAPAVPIMVKQQGGGPAVPRIDEHVDHASLGARTMSAGKLGDKENNVSVATTFNPIAAKRSAGPGSSSKSIRRKPLNDTTNLLSMYKNERLKNDFLVQKIKETKKQAATSVGASSEISSQSHNVILPSIGKDSSDEVVKLKELNSNYEKKIMELEEVLLLTKLNGNNYNNNNNTNNSSNISINDDSSANISFDNNSSSSNTMTAFKECLLNQNDIITQVRASFEEIVDGLQASLSDTVFENERRYELAINNLTQELEDNSNKLLIAENSIAMLKSDLSSKESSICALSNNIKLYETNIARLKSEMSDIKRLCDSKNIAINIIAASNNSLKSELIITESSIVMGEGGDCSVSSSHLTNIVNEVTPNSNLVAVVSNLQSSCNAIKREKESLAADNSRLTVEMQQLRKRCEIMDVRCRSNESYIESLEQSLDVDKDSDSSRHGLLVEQNKNLIATISYCKHGVNTLSDSLASSEARVAALQLQVEEKGALAQSLEQRLLSCEKDLASFRSGLEGDKNQYICTIADLESRLLGSVEERTELESQMERVREDLDVINTTLAGGGDLLERESSVRGFLMDDSDCHLSPIKQSNHQEDLLRALATPTVSSSSKKSRRAPLSVSPGLRLSPRLDLTSLAGSPLSAIQLLDNQLKLRLAAVSVDSPFEREAARETSYGYLSKRIGELSREVGLKSELISQLNYSNHLLQRSLNELSSSSALESANSRRAVECYKADLASQAGQVTALRSNALALEVQLAAKMNELSTDKENMRYVHDIEVGVYAKKLAEAQAELQALRHEVDSMYSSIDSPFKRAEGERASKEREISLS